MDWYEVDVRGAVNERLNCCSYEPETIFYGSSSIRLWDTLYTDFKEYKPVNLGFGGSTLAACVTFFDRIVSPLKSPHKLILYAGDNDLGDGRSPEDVLHNFREFRRKLRKSFPNIEFYFISIKPSLSRNGLIKQIEHANSLVEKEIISGSDRDHFVNVYSKMLDEKGRPIASMFSEDGLHMNANGYRVWKNVILEECLMH